MGNGLFSMSETLKLLLLPVPLGPDQVLALGSQGLLPR